MTENAPQPSPGRRFFWGLAVASLVTAVLGYRLLDRKLEDLARSRCERLALVKVQALAQVVERASAVGHGPAAEAGSGFAAELGPAAAAPEAAPAEGSSDPAGGAVRLVVFRFTHGPGVHFVRVVEGREIVASTAPRDEQYGPAPRPLRRDEKPLFDLAQALRSAVEGNREGAEGGAVRADEIVLQWKLPEARSREPMASRLRLLLSVPFERDGTVAGLVQIQSDPPFDHAQTPLPVEWLLATLVFLGLSFVLPQRRIMLAGLAAALLLAVIVHYGYFARRVVAAEQKTTAERVAAAVAMEAERANAILAEINAPAEPPFTPLAWDTDLHRKPLGEVSAPGQVDAAHLAAEIAATGRETNRTTLALSLLGLLLLGYVGFGWASRTGRALVEHRQAYLYTLPALAGMLVLVFFPFFYGIALSFTNANIYNSDKPVADIWVGLDNYRDILSDVHVSRSTANGRVWDYGNFYWTLGFTVLWTVSNVSIGVTLGLLLALSLNTKGLAFRAGYRVLLILPWAVPSYISALIFRGMFHQQYGVVNQLLQIAGFAPIAWFDRPLTSFLAVLTTNGWLSFPFMMVVSLGALQSIPADLYEAARVDGAGRWQQFRSITLPSLKPALVPAVILSVIWTFNMFNIIYLVSAGQPSGATEILITQAYKLAFEQYRYGYAAAYSTVIFLILLVYGTWQNRVTRATEAVAE